MKNKKAFCIIVLFILLGFPLFVQAGSEVINISYLKYPVTVYYAEGTMPNRMPVEGFKEMLRSNFRDTGYPHTTIKDITNDKGFKCPEMKEVAILHSSAYAFYGIENEWIYVYYASNNKWYTFYVLLTND
ncbi:MAG: hypothetical protein Pg6A_00720 [Termitinemataceae bacterium]|nr:MAG: hypothetical protein Pg6A_00720 [Termitinemataceae bacterium]